MKTIAIVFISAALFAGVVLFTMQDGALETALKNGDGEALCHLIQSGLNPQTEVCIGFEQPDWTTWFPFSLVPYNYLPKTCRQTSPLIVEAVRSVRGADGQKVVEALLQRGVDVNTNSTAYGTPLFVAISNQDYDLTRFLLEHGAKITSDIDFGMGSPLPFASPAIFRLLAEHGLTVRGNDAKHDALFWACTTGNVEVARYLLERGETPNQKLINGKTPLRCAQENDRKAVVKLLLAKGAKYVPYTVRGKMVPFTGRLPNAPPPGSP